MNRPIEDIQRIFDQLVDAPESQRTALLGSLCGADSALRDEVEHLLESYQRSLGSPALTGPVDAGYAAAALDVPGVEQPLPERIGPFRVLRQIGEGGFGLVYLAERREPFHQVVAVKVLKPGMDSRAILARFAHERQALAMLSHPNIAKILDAGQTEAGYPYFVMEYVEGEPITKFCDVQALSIAQTIGLLIDVASAVQHAHARGVIHRDIKPANILVHLHGEQIRATVIDFGIARLLHADRGQSHATEALAMIGTPEYMSPEQAELGAAGVDTRADVYGLGAVLYELLAGRPPLIAERARSGSPATLAALLRGVRPAMPQPSHRPPHWPASTAMTYRELAWIALKALRPDREDRYQSAAEFVSDLRACLGGGAIAAGPDSRLYLARKFAKRHRAAVVAGAGVLLGLTMLAAGQMYSARRERELRMMADEARQTAETRGRQISSAQVALVRQSSLANLAAAAAQIESGDALAARERLASIPDPARAWEWGLLWSMTDEAAARVRPFRAMIESMSLSRDGRMLGVAANLDGMKVLDAQSFSTIKRLDGHEQLQSVACVFHPTEDVLITGGFDGRIRILSLPALEVVREIQLDHVDDVRLSPNGRTMAYRQPQTRAAVVLDYPDLHERSRFGLGVSDLAFIGDGSQLAVAGGHRLQITDLDGHVHRSSPIPVDFADIAVSADGALIAAACSDQTIIFRADDLEPIRTLTHETAVRTVMFAADGGSILTMGLEQALRQWDLSTGRLLDRRLAPVQGLRAGPIDLAGGAFFTGSPDGSVIRWQARNPRAIDLPGTRLSFAEIDPTGERLALCSWRSGTIRVLDVDTLIVLNTIVTGWLAVDTVRFTRDSDTLLIAGHLGAATVDLRTGRVDLLRVPGRLEPGPNLVPLPDGRFVFGFPEQTPCILDPLTREVIEPAGWSDLGLPIGASRSGKRLAFHNATHDVAIVDTATGRVDLAMLGQRERTHTAVFSSDEHWVALGNWSSQLAIHELVSGERITELTVNGATRTLMALNDSSRLIVTDVGGYLRVFDSADFAPTLSLRIGAGWTAATLSDDGRTLITFDVNDRVRKWTISEPASLGSLAPGASSSSPAPW